MDCVRQDLIISCLTQFIHIFYGDMDAMDEMRANTEEWKKTCYADSTKLRAKKKVLLFSKRHTK